MKVIPEKRVVRTKPDIYVFIVRSFSYDICPKSDSKVFGSNKTTGPKQDNQNQLRSPMPEGGEP
jgi:hypothetical protein